MAAIKDTALMVEKEVLERKKNIFEHIFYEIEMYLFTHGCCVTYSRALFSAEDEIAKVQLQRMYNMAWDAHMLHLRNLLEFFNDVPNTIGFQTVCIVPNDLQIDDNETKYKQVINKSVDHLTIERIKWDNMTYRAIDAVNEMWRILLNRIQRFLGYLTDEENVRDQYKEDLKEDFIRNKLDDLLRTFSATETDS